MTYKILDLFSGLGGFSLGLERTGHFKTIAFCDNDKFSKLILDKHWKGIKIYDNVKEISKEKFIADGIQFPDIITGGFPCQPFSIAGKQKGTSDDRHLWPEMFRIIKAFKPRYVIGENVRGIINIQDGMVFETVCTDLESEGYEVQSFNIPAAGVGAPHRRERIWIVAHSNNARNRTPKYETNENRQKTNEGRQGQSQFKFSGYGEDVENPRRTLRQRSSIREKNENEIREEDANMFKRSSGSSKSDVANTESKSSDSEHNRKKSREISEQEQIESRRSDSWSLREANWLVEPNVGRVANGVSGRVHRLKALGNSIVPQIAEEIGRAIIKAEKE